MTTSTSTPAASRSRRLAGAAWRHRTLALPLALAIAFTASYSGYSMYRIRPGDTLSSLAVRYHTTVARLIAINNLPGNGDLIIAGQELRVPGHASTTVHRTAEHYVARPGDSVDRIASRFHVSPSRLARDNHLPSSLVVVIGQRLVIPGHYRHVAAAPSQGGSGTAAALRDRSLLADRDEPDSDEIAAMIRSTSAHWGLDPRLALAISWQESGWNMREVSGVDAIGAMQVMPYTASYLSANVVHRSLDLYNAQDNITAGVALLSVLTHEASDTPQAIAGYYQGLASVRAHGMLPSTKQYVADVMALRSRY